MSAALVTTTDNTVDAVVPVNQRDDVFFFEDAYLKVETTIFKVHKRYLMTESEVFNDMWDVPSGGQQPQGLSFDDPILLEGFKAQDFRQLLRVLFPSEWGKQDKLETDEWLAVLDLATRWNFQNIRKLAIKRLDTDLSPHPARKVAVARQFDVAGWLVPALNDLAQRKESVQLADANFLGVDWALKLAQVREQYPNPCSCPKPPRLFAPPVLPPPNLFGAPPAPAPAGPAPGAIGQPGAAGQFFHFAQLADIPAAGRRRVDAPVAREFYDFKPLIKKVFELP